MIATKLPLTLPIHLHHASNFIPCTTHINASTLLILHCCIYNPQNPSAPPKMTFGSLIHSRGLCRNAKIGLPNLCPLSSITRSTTINHEQLNHRYRPI
ncbi:putative TNF receptor-associated factor 3 isoform X3 [Sesbania bispinosa]|nr:putative TNF receptor-associated factor 3 isoform X3 [Sesbania bispinosa]